MAVFMNGLNAGSYIMKELSEMNFVIQPYQRCPAWDEYRFHDVMLSDIELFHQRWNLFDEPPKMSAFGYISLDEIIITTPEIQVDAFGNKHTTVDIVDGQQRLLGYSIVNLVFAKLFPNLQLGSYYPLKMNAITEEFQPLVYSKHTEKIFNRLAHEDAFKMDIRKMNSHERRIVQNYKYAYKLIESLNMSEEEAAMCIQWYGNKGKVTFIEVSKDEAPYAFIMKNTGHRNLANFDILKGIIIAGAQEHADAINDAWFNTFEKLKEIRALGKIDKDIVSVVRSIIGDKVGTSRDKSFDAISVNFGEYLKNNLEEHGYSSVEDFLRFNEEVLFRIDALIVLKTGRYDSYKYRNLFALRNTDNSYGDALCLSVVNPDDKEAEWLAKIDIAAQTYLNINYQLCLHGEPRGDGKMRFPVVELMNAIRGKDIMAIAEACKDEIEKHKAKLAAANKKPKLPISEGSDWLTRYVTSSVEMLLWVISGKKDIKFLWEKNRQKLDKWEKSIEHAVTAQLLYGVDGNGCFSEIDFLNYRARLANQSLVSLSLNSQLQDLPVTEKLDHYMKHSEWLGSLSPKYYTKNGEIHNASLREWATANGIIFKPLADGVYTKDYLEHRTELHMQLLNYIHDGERLIENAKDHAQAIKNNKLEFEAVPYKVS